MTSIAASTKTARIARIARQARGLSVPLLLAGALAAGCGTTHASATGGAADQGASASSAPKASVTPVPTVTGGTVAAGEPACVGWPSGAAHGKVTALFDTVAVERCVTGFQTGPGKAEWETATLEKATKNLTPLIAALLRPSVGHQPQTICPELAMIPPQVVLISSTGEKLIPTIPLTGCGEYQSQFDAALATMTWQPVSVRLLNKVTGSQPGSTTNKVVSPKAIKTLGNAASLSWLYDG